MPTFRTLMFAAVIAAGLSGCYSHTSYHRVNPLDAISGKYSENIILKEDVSVWISFIEAPYYDTAIIDAQCPSRSGSITKAKGFTSALVQMVTLGIYHSITVEIGCEKKAVATRTLTPEQAKAVVADARFVDAVRKGAPSLAADAERAHASAHAERLAAR